MTEFEFQAWPKTTRLFRDIIVTEKIDGTNAAIQFDQDGNVAAQSRKRLITPDSDNFGFARWVYENQDDLFYILGPGTHFGEWWGKGIQRGYGMTHKVFSVFNGTRFYDTSADTVHGLDSCSTRAFMKNLYEEIRAVPQLYSGPFSEVAISQALYELRDNGSRASDKPFKNPEGVCVFHTQSRVVQKVTLDNEDRGKWEL